MRQFLLSALPYERDWRHQSLTLRLAISRENIHVLAIQTFRTMIGVTISMNRYSAMRTLKILYSPPEHCIRKYTHHKQQKISLSFSIARNLPPSENYLFNLPSQESSMESCLRSGGFARKSTRKKKIISVATESH